MLEMLKSLGLFKTFKVKIPVSRKDMVEALRANVDPEGFDAFEVFRNGKHYKGTVSEDRFQIKRRRVLGESSGMPSSVVTGYLRSDGNSTSIELEVNGLPSGFLFFFGFLVLAYLFGLVLMLTSNQGAIAMMAFSVGILAHAAFMFGIFYFVLRRGLTRTIYNIERDLFFMVKDKIKAVA